MKTEIGMPGHYSGLFEYQGGQSGIVYVQPPVEPGDEAATRSALDKSWGQDGILSPSRTEGDQTIFGLNNPFFTAGVLELGDAVINALNEAHQQRMAAPSAPEVQN